MRAGIIALTVVLLLNLGGAVRSYADGDWGWFTLNMAMGAWMMGSILALAFGAHAKRGDRIEPDREAGQ